MIAAVAREQGPGGGALEVREPGLHAKRVLRAHRMAHGDLDEIRAPFDGILLLPLYQPDGDDGFFYGHALDA